MGIHYTLYSILVHTVVLLSDLSHIYSALFYILYSILLLFFVHLPLYISLLFSIGLNFIFVILLFVYRTLFKKK